MLGRRPGCEGRLWLCTASPMLFRGARARRYALNETRMSPPSGRRSRRGHTHLTPPWRRGFRAEGCKNAFRGRIVRGFRAVEQVAAGEVLGQILRNGHHGGGAEGGGDIGVPAVVAGEGLSRVIRGEFLRAPRRLRVIDTGLV
jgi:hypothetical protein